MVRLFPAWIYASVIDLDLGSPSARRRRVSAGGGSTILPIQYHVSRLSPKYDGQSWKIVKKRATRRLGQGRFGTTDCERSKRFRRSVNVLARFPRFSGPEGATREQTRPIGCLRCGRRASRLRSRPRCGRPSLGLGRPWRADTNLAHHGRHESGEDRKRSMPFRKFFPFRDLRSYPQSRLGVVNRPL